MLRLCRFARRLLMRSTFALDLIDSALSPFDTSKRVQVQCVFCGRRGPEWLCDGCVGREPETKA